MTLIVWTFVPAIVLTIVLTFAPAIVLATIGLRALRITLRGPPLLRLRLIGRRLSHRAASESNALLRIRGEWQC